MGSEMCIRDRALNDMNLIMRIITGIRNIRGEMNIPPSKHLDIIANIPNKKDFLLVMENIEYIKVLAKIEKIEVQPGAQKPKHSATAVVGENEIHVLLEGILDFREEISRITRELKRMEKEIAGARRKLDNKAFLEKAPPDVVQKVKNKMQAMELRIEKLQKNLEFFRSIND